MDLIIETDTEPIFNVDPAKIAEYQPHPNVSSNTCDLEDSSSETECYGLLPVEYQQRDSMHNSSSETLTGDLLSISTEKMQQTSSNFCSRTSKTTQLKMSSLQIH
jgi:hypothetical protein